MASGLPVLDHVTLLVSDMEASRRFYLAALALPAVRQLPFLIRQRLSAPTGDTKRSCATWARARAWLPLPVFCSSRLLPRRVAGGSCPARTRVSARPGR